MRKENEKWRIIVWVIDLWCFLVSPTQQIDGSGLVLLAMDSLVGMLKLPVGPAVTLDGILKRCRELRGIPPPDAYVANAEPVTPQPDVAAPEAVAPAEAEARN